MSSVNGQTPLSVLDLLGLAEQRKVARLALGAVGYSGIVYVCDLTAGQQQRISNAGKRGKTRVYRDQSMDVDWADLTQDAAAKVLEACLVTDKANGETLERAFAALETEEDTPHIIFPAAELQYVADLMAVELKTKSKALEKLEQFPNAVSSLIIKTMRELSGMTDDRVEEKKDNS